jgi:hypothetical protein
MTRQVGRFRQAAEIYLAARVGAWVRPDRPREVAAFNRADQVARCRPARRQRAALSDELRVRRKCGVSNTDW